jgi:hypothetical protein
LYFEIISEIQDIETIAIGGNIRNIINIQKKYGTGRWRKLKGVAKIRLSNGKIAKAELHWYEAHGIGKKKMKIKQLLD